MVPFCLDTKNKRTLDALVVAVSIDGPCSLSSCLISLSVCSCIRVYVYSLTH